MSFHRVITGDCLEVLKTLDAGSIDAVVTDPPYGLDIIADGTIGGSNFATATNYRASDWDENGMSVEQFAEIRRVSREQIVWGFNHLAAVTGPCRGILVWDKKCQNGWDDNFSDVETAWCSHAGPDKCFRYRWMGGIREGEREKRVHPSQKPVPLMAWCLERLGLAAGATVLDPFCGSGSTGVAAKSLGLNFIGVERDSIFATIARRRIADAASLFHQTEREPEPTLLGATPCPT